jgi:hypothetical protein
MATVNTALLAEIGAPGGNSRRIWEEFITPGGAFSAVLAVLLNATISSE